MATTNGGAPNGEQPKAPQAGLQTRALLKAQHPR